MSKVLDNEQHGTGAEQASIWRNRNVVLLWLAQFISLFGDYIFYIAVVWFALEMTGDNGIAGLVAMCVHLPMIFFSLVSGTLVDRWDRRRTMITADAARCSLLLLFPLLAGAGTLGIVAIAVLVFTVESFTSLFNPARDVLIAELTPPEQLTEANSLIQSALPFAIVLGPALAAAILPFVGILHLFTFDAATFALSLVFLLAVKPPRRPVQHITESSGVASDIVKGLKYAGSEPVMRWLLIITAADNWFIMGPAIIGFPILFREIIGEPVSAVGLTLSSAQMYSLNIATFAVGFVAGTYLAGMLSKRLNKGRMILLGIFLDGITFVPLLWIRDPNIILGLTLVHGAAVPLITVTRTTMIQQMVPRELRGRVFSLINLVVYGLTAFSVGATGFLTQVIRVDMLFALWGLGAAVLGPIGWMVGSLREAGSQKSFALETGEEH